MSSNARYDAFLSYNSYDRPAVEELAGRLRAEGLALYLEVWELLPGREFQPALTEGLRDSKTCIACLGPNGLGPWQKEEIQVAIDKRVRDPDFHVIPVLLPGAERPRRGKVAHLEFLINASWVEFPKSLDDRRAFDSLVAGIRGIKPTLSPEEVKRWEGRRPYRGLEAFGPDDAPFFFGRENLTDWLVSDLRREIRAPVGVRFLAVLGPSGSGKSSVVLAGLIPRLKEGAIDGSERWPIAVVRPGDDPLKELGTTVAAQFVPAGSLPDARQALQFSDDMRSDERMLDAFARMALNAAPAEARLLVVVDQFEEVFTYRPEDEKKKEAFAKGRDAFFANLLHAAAAPGARVAVVLTMRSDFLGPCASFERLNNVLNAHLIQVGPMREDELRAAIEQPAFKVSCELEPGLTERLLADVEGQAGTLPLLQFTLDELWQRREVRRLTLRAYTELGGVEGALEHRANETLQKLSQADQDLCRRIFLHLVQPGEGTEDTKRRVSYRELLPADPERAEAVKRVVGILANRDARLITTQGTGTADGAVEVAHEALIRGWGRLRTWIDSDRVGLRIHRQVTEAAREWEANGRESSFLYGGTRLAVAREWAKAHRDEPNALEAEFLVTSVQQQQQRHADELEAARRLAEEAEARRLAEEGRALEAEQREREAKARVVQERKARRLTAALAFLGMMLLTVGGWLAFERKHERVRLAFERELERLREQKQTDALVNRALDKMDTHFKEADKAPVDEPEQRKEVADQWRSVLYFAKQAEEALETGTPSSSLRKHTEDTLGVIRKKATAADRDRKMLDLLEDARYAKSRISNADIDYTLARPYIYGSAGAELYAKAFRDYGIDVTALDFADAATRVRARRPIRRNLVAALDDWYQVNPTSNHSGRLLAVADDADDDAVRKRIRAAIGRKDRSELLRIADGPEADSFSPQTALLLAYGLETPRDTNDSARVARRALRRHPDDFWLNDLAGLYFTSSDPPRPLEALAAYQAALAARPDSNMVLINIGITWSSLGDYDRAAAVFSQSLERDKHYLTIRAGLFQALLNSGNLAGAEAAARDWVRDEPGSPLALGSLARVLYLSGKPEEARKLMKDAVDHQSRNGTDAMSIAQDLLGMGRNQDAIPYFRQAANLAKHNGEVASSLGFALLNTGHLKEGLEELRRGVELTSRSAWCWTALAQGLASDGKIEEAFAADRKALERDPFQSAVRVTYAQHLRLAGRPQEALAVAEEAVRLNPRDGSALAEQGLCLAGLRCYPEAIRSLELAIRLQPWNGALRESLGDVLKVNNDATSAVTAYKEAIRLMPDTARLHNALGNAYFDLKDYPRSIAAYRSAIDRDKKEPIFKTNLANALRLDGQQTEALALYREAVTLAPDNADVRRTCCTGLYEMGRNDEAIEEGGAAVRLAPAVAASHNVLGIALMRAGRPAAAVEEYRKAVRLSPTDPVLLTNLAEALAVTGKSAEAEMTARDAVRLDTNNTACLKMLGNVLHANRRYKEAVDAFRDAVRLEPGNPWYHFFLAGSLIPLGKPAWDEALSAAKKAVELAPNQPVYSSRLGEVYAVRGELKDAEAAYRKSVKPEPGDGSVLFEYAKFLFSQKRYSDAAEVTEKAIRIAPNNAIYHSSLAWCYFELKQMDEAVAAQQRAVKLSPADAAAVRMLGVYIRRAGRPEEALRWFDAAIKIRPDWASPHWALGRTLGQLGRHADAVGSLQHAEELLPNDRAEAEQIGWQVEHDLGVSLRHTGRFVEALAAFRKAKELASKIASPQDLPEELRGQLRSLDEAVRRCERFTKLDGILGGVRAETVTATDPVAALELAAFAQQHKNWPHTAVRLAEKAFTSNPKLAADLSDGHRLTAARAAAAASTGRGDDAERLDSAEKTRLRKLALGWLRADLEVWKPRAANPIRSTPDPIHELQHWLRDPDLAGLRDKDALEKLPEEERNEWSALWAEVEELINRPK